MHQEPEHIYTFLHLEQKNLENNAADAPITVDENSTSNAAPAGALKQELLYSEIKRLMKALKGHRCAIDFDRGFVNSKVKRAKGKRMTIYRSIFMIRIRSESECRKISRHSTLEICMGSYILYHDLASEGLR